MKIKINASVIVVYIAHTVHGYCAYCSCIACLAQIFLSELSFSFSTPDI